MGGRRWSGAALGGVLGLGVALTLAAVVGSGAEDWRQVTGPRQWAFPRDHGAHPGYRTEWWYFTGNLADPGGRRYGYQLTFFRVGVRTAPAVPDNPWSVRDVYLGHLAVTDAAAGSFRFAESAARPGPGLAGASRDDLEVWLLGWSARRGPDGAIRLCAEAEGVGVDLTLRARKPVVLHGDGGVSRKGPDAGQASYYASLTDLATSGRVRPGPGRPWVEVAGVSWFDQEFGSNQLGEGQVGWDWLSLHLSDGRDLMVYRLRRQDGSPEPSSSGTLVEADGRSVHLPLAAFALDALARWDSPRSGGRYPSRWRLRVPGHGIDLTLEPILADQELVTGQTTAVTYWEGAVTGSGSSGGVAVDCRGYAELTGYAGSLGGRF